MIARAADPRIDYVTYLGGIYSDTANSIAIDSTGAAYVAGNTYSPDFPLTSTAFGVPDLNQSCGFVAKINPSGTAIDFSVCRANQSAQAVGLDASGNIYVMVNDVSSGASADNAAGSSLVKLDPTAATVLYDVPIGGQSSQIHPEAFAVDGAGNVYVTGSAYAGLATTPNAYQREVAPGDSCLNTIPTPVATGPCPDAFVMKFSPAGAMSYATYVGGSGLDDAHAIAVDSAGDAWIAGETISPNFPTTANAFSKTFHGELDLWPLQFGDAFVAELDPTGTKLLYSTYLGGSAVDGALAIAVDAAGAAYVAGGTQSADFPATQGALQTTYTGKTVEPCLRCDDGFVAKFSASGTLVYSTYLGGWAGAIAVDSLGQAYVEAAQKPPIVVLNPSGSAVAASSPFGGGRMVLDGKGGLYTAGSTGIQVFFSTLHALQTQYGGGGSDGFVAKLDFTQPAQPALNALVNAASMLEGNYSLSAYNGAVAPGEVVTLFGSGFGTDPTVSFDTVSAPILYASDTQINAVVQYEVFEPLVVTVMSGSETIAVAKLPLVDAVPAIFTTTGSGTGQAAILNRDGTVNSPSNPAPRGSTVSLWMTGAGGMTTFVRDGSLGPLTAPFPVPALSVSASIDGDQAPVQYAGQAPGLVAGIVQVNFAIPLNAKIGSAVPIGLQVGYFISPSVTMAIQ
jgi:uncharacterized protein (TIGR03437 family)